VERAVTTAFELAVPPGWELLDSDLELEARAPLRPGGAAAPAVRVQRFEDFGPLFAFVPVYSLTQRNAGVGYEPADLEPVDVPGAAEALRRSSRTTEPAPVGDGSLVELFVGEDGRTVWTVVVVGSAGDLDLEQADAIVRSFALVRSDPEPAPE
jgi:hypothetical protein